MACNYYNLAQNIANKFRSVQLCDHESRYQYFELIRHWNRRLDFLAVPVVNEYSFKLSR